MSDAPMFLSSGAPVYARCPRSVLRNPNLSMQARMVYTLLDDFASKESQVVFPSQELLAEYTGASVRSVRQYLNELAAAGLIVVNRSGRSNHVRIMWPQEPPYDPGQVVEDDPEGPEEVSKVADHDESRSAKKGTSDVSKVADQIGRNVTTKKYQEEEPTKNPSPTPSGGRGNSGGSSSTLPGLEPGNPTAGASRRRPNRQCLQGLALAEFDRMWADWPGKTGKSAAQKAYAKATDQLPEIQAQLGNYLAARALAESLGANLPTMGFATFLNGKRIDWSEPWSEDDVRSYWGHTITEPAVATMWTYDYRADLAEERSA